MIAGNLKLGVFDVDMTSISEMKSNISSKDYGDRLSSCDNDQYSDIISAVAIQFSEKILEIPTKALFASSGSSGNSVSVSTFASLFAANILSIPLLAFNLEKIRFSQYLSQPDSSDKKSELVEALAEVTPAELRSALTDEIVKKVLNSAIEKVLGKCKSAAKKASRKFSICPNVDSDDHDHHILAKLDQMLMSSPTARQKLPQGIFISYALLIYFVSLHFLKYSLLLL